MSIAVKLQCCTAAAMLATGLAAATSAAELPPYMEPIAGTVTTTPTASANADILALDTAMFQLYDESRRYFMLQNVREKVANADVAWSFDLGPYTTLTPRIGWQRFRFLTGQVTYRRYGELALVHQVNPDNFGSLRLRNDSSDVYSPIPGAHGYRVNVVFAQWTHLF